MWHVPEIRQCKHSKYRHCTILSASRAHASDISSLPFLGQSAAPPLCRGNLPPPRERVPTRARARAPYSHSCPPSAAGHHDTSVPRSSLGPAPGGESAGSRQRTGPLPELPTRRTPCARAAHHREAHHATDCAKAPLSHHHTAASLSRPRFPRTGSRDALIARQSAAANGAAAPPRAPARDPAAAISAS